MRGYRRTAIERKPFHSPPPISSSDTIKVRNGAGLHRAQTASANQANIRAAKATRRSTAHGATSTGRASTLACAASCKGPWASRRSHVCLRRLPLGKVSPFRSEDRAGRGALCKSSRASRRNRNRACHLGSFSPFKWETMPTAETSRKRIAPSRQSTPILH